MDRRRRRSTDGFTLIEILVVLSIIAVLLSFTPSIMAGIPGLRLRAAVSDVAGTLRRLRDDAIRTAVPTIFVLDPAHLRYATATGQQDLVYRPLPAAIDTASLTTASPVRLGDQPQLRFFPDGSATAASLRLLHAGHARTITVDWLTGRVTTDG